MKELTFWLLYAYLAAVNIALFAAMGADKARAIRHRRRIPESTLFLLCLIGGSAGGVLGMFVFRHKTRHRSFSVGFPLILLAHIVLCIYIAAELSAQ